MVTSRIHFHVHVHARERRRAVRAAQRAEEVVLENVDVASTESTEKVVDVVVGKDSSDKTLEEKV